MPDFLIQFFNWLANPDIPALLTVAGLGAFLKLVAIPGIKALALGIKHPISGAATVWTVFISAFVFAEAAGAIVHHGITGILFWQLLGVAIGAGFAALGIQSTTTAVLRPESA